MKTTPKLLNEISYKNYDKLKNVVADLEVNKEFDNLFKGNKRIVIPFTRGGMKGEIGEIIEFFNSQGFDVDLKNGVIKKEIEYEIPKGEKKGQKVKKTFNERIGKVLKLFEDFEEAEFSPNKEKRKNLGDKIRKIFNIQTIDPDIIFFKRGEPSKGSKWSKWWASKSEYYRKNPEAIKEQSEYSIIISQASTDLLRMSDFSNIRSCHSQGQSYFKCVWSEIKTQSSIAYLVKTEDLKNIDLTADEIFKDKERGVDGINPLSRVRLRKYKDNSRNKFFLVPEARVYGDRPPGVVDELIDWAWEKQKDIFEGEVPEIEEIQSFGGSYKDTNDGQLLNSFFKTDKFADSEETEHHNEDEDEQSEFDRIEHEADEIDQYANQNLQYVGVSHILEGDEEPYLFFNALVGFKFKDKEINNEALEQFQNLSWREKSDQYYNPIKDVVEMSEEVEFNVLAGEDMYINISLSSSEEPPTPEGYRDFVEWLIQDVEPNYKKWHRQIRDFLIEKGLIKSDKRDEIIQLLKQNPFNHFDVDFDKNGEIDISLKKKIVLTRRKDDIDKFEKDEKRISYFFGNRFKANIEDFVKKAAIFALKQMDLFSDFVPPKISKINTIVDLIMRGDYSKLEREYRGSIVIGPPITFDYFINVETKQLVGGDETNHQFILYIYEMIKYFDENFDDFESIAFKTMSETLEKYIREFEKSEDMPKDFANEGYSLPTEEDILIEFFERINTQL